MLVLFAVWVTEHRRWKL